MNCKDRHCERLSVADERGNLLEVLSGDYFVLVPIDGTRPRNDDFKNTNEDRICLNNTSVKK